MQEKLLRRVKTKWRRYFHVQAIADDFVANFKHCKNVFKALSLGDLQVMCVLHKKFMVKFLSL